MPKFTQPIINNKLLAGAFVSADDNNTNINMINVRVLFDTGATKSWIKKKIVKQLKLKPFGKVNMVSASNVVPSNLYRIKIAFPFPTSEKNSIRIEMVKELEVMETINSDSFDIIIGMDIIHKGLLIVSDNIFTFSL